MKVYKNGVLDAMGGTKTNGWEPNVITRTQNWLGRSGDPTSDYFDGTIAYLKIWHGVELQQSYVTDLYAPHNTAHHFFDFRNCDATTPVIDSVGEKLRGVKRRVTNSIFALMIWLHW